MNIITQIIIILSAAAIFILSSCGKEDSDSERLSKGQKQVLSQNEGENSKENAAETADAVYYDIKLEGNFIRLYEVCGTFDGEIKSIPIDRSYYPAEDIERLENGITAYNRESAFEILENFTN